MTSYAAEYSEDKPEQKGGFLSRLFKKVADTIEWMKVDFEKDSLFNSRVDERHRQENIERLVGYALEDVKEPSTKNYEQYINQFLKDNDHKESDYFNYGDIRASEVMLMLEKTQKENTAEQTSRHISTLEA